MNRKIAFIFPGQGAQYIGMGRDFFEQFPIARQTFEEADELLHKAFSKEIFEGDQKELSLTKNSQLAIYITSIALLRAMQSQFPDVKPWVCAGLSLGEYSALLASEKISFQKGLFLVKARAEWMQSACHENEGAMQAVLGLDALEVEAIVAELQKKSLRVYVANLNCPGQVVISGAKKDVEIAAVLLKEKGAKRSISLDVSGAFHSGLMKSAEKGLRPLIEQVELKQSPTEVVMNVTGKKATSIDEIRKNLISQLTQPVRWEASVRTMVEEQIHLYIEIGPGKTLSGMNQKIKVSAPTISIEKIADLEKIEEPFNAAFKR